MPRRMLTTRRSRVANALATRVEEQLRPVIGTVLAAVSVDVESRRIGKTPDTIDYADLPSMAENLIDALNLVVGREMAQAAARKVLQL
jgi:hypothetical protein